MPKIKTEIYKLYFLLLALAALLCILWVVSVVWQPSFSSPSPKFLLRDKGGYAALYSADGSELLEVYHIYTRLLPESEILLLQEGISVQDEAALQQKLREYEEMDE